MKPSIKIGSVTPLSRSSSHSSMFDAVDVDNKDILCDKLRLNQVLLNLLSNAVKYTKNGGQIIVRIIQKPGFSNGYAT